MSTCELNLRAFESIDYHINESSLMIEFLRNTVPASGRSPKEIETLRDRLTSFSILIAFSAGFPVVAYKIYDAIENGYALSTWPVLAVYACFGLIGVLRKSLNYRIRAGISISLMFLTAFFSLTHLGIIPAALVASLASSVLSITLLGRQTGGLLALFICGIGITISTALSVEVVGSGMDAYMMIEMIIRWWPQLLAVIAFYFSLTLSLCMIEGSLKKTIRQLEDRRADLESLNKALLESKNRAEDASAAKSQFMSVMSHELRTPLNPVAGFVNLLRDEVKNEEAHEFLDHIENASSHLLELIDSILEFVQVDAASLDHPPFDFDLYEFCNEFYESSKHLVEEKNLQFYLKESVQGDQTMVSGYPEHIRRILGLLLSNSLRFTEQGSIALTAGIESDSESHDHVWFSIRDTGVGISEKEMPKIFDAFYQISDANTRDHGGIGLGLSMAKKLAGILNADITVESKPGEGSTFTLTVPAKVGKQSS
jgi:signal transduction histidine kinase